MPSHRTLLWSLLAVAGLQVAAAERPDDLDTSNYEWPVHTELRTYGIRLRMPYEDARARMLANGWQADETESKAKYGQKPLPFPKYREIVCGEGYDAICSGWFVKGNDERLIDVRETDGKLIVRGSR